MSVKSLAWMVILTLMLALVQRSFFFGVGTNFGVSVELVLRSLTFALVLILALVLKSLAFALVMKYLR